MTKSIHQKPDEEIKLEIDRYGEILNFNLTTTIREIPDKVGTSNVGAIGIIPQIIYDENDSVSSFKFWHYSYRWKFWDDS